MAESVEIPDDIKQTATRFAGEYLAHDVSCDRLYRDVAALLLAERMRCAGVALRVGSRVMGRDVANAIVAPVDAAVATPGEIGEQMCPQGTPINEAINGRNPVDMLLLEGRDDNCFIPA